MRLALKARMRRALARAGALLRDPRRRGVPLTFIRPCYWVVDRLSADSVILDFGLGFDADFSQAMIGRYGLTSVGFDPTRRHQPGLRELAQRSGGKFSVHELALGGRPGTAVFHESQQNVSGSLHDGHSNVRRDTIKSYEVRVVSLAEALAMSPAGHADLVKMDIEGSEYEVIENTPEHVLQAADQWVIEFHHDLISGIRYSRTRACLDRFRRAGFESYTRDNVNFLLYKPAPTHG